MGCGWLRESSDCKRSMAIGELKVWGCNNVVITYQNMKKLQEETHLRFEGINPTGHRDWMDHGRSWPSDGGRTLGHGP